MIAVAVVAAVTAAKVYRKTVIGDVVIYILKTGERKERRRSIQESKRRRRRSLSSSSSSSSTLALPSSSKVRFSGDKSAQSTDEEARSDGKQIREFSENDHPLIPNPPDQEEQIDEEVLRQAREFKKAVQRKDIHKDSDSEDDDMGPMPLVNPDSNANASINQNQKHTGKHCFLEKAKHLLHMYSKIYVSHDVEKLVTMQKILHMDFFRLQMRQCADRFEISLK